MIRCTHHTDIQRWDRRLLWEWDGAINQPQMPSVPQSKAAQIVKLYNARRRVQTQHALVGSRGGTTGPKVVGGGDISGVLFVFFVD